MALGDTVRAKLAQVIARYGETLSISDGASSRSVSAQVGIMELSARYRFFTSSETSGYASPLLSVRIAGDDAAAVGHTFIRAGRTWTVRKKEQPKIGGVIICTLLLCS